MRYRRWLGLLLCGAALLGMVFYWLSVASSTAKSLPAGSTLNADDFGVTPIAVDARDRIGETSARPGNSFYLVRFRIENRSLSDTFDFEQHLILARPLGRGKLVRSQSGQRALGIGGEPMSLDPGRAAERTLVFEGPAQLANVGVLFDLHGGPGELLRGLFGDAEQVVVPVSRISAS